MNLWIFAFCTAVGVLGLAGIVMGLGYIVNKRTQLPNETLEYHQAILAREKKTGWASIIAGVGVALSSIPLYLIITGFMYKLSIIEAAVLGR